MPRTYRAITLDIDDGIATITLARPDRLNAFDVTMQDDLLAAFDQTDGDDDVRVVVVTGQGRTFCAGADLSSGTTTFDYAVRPPGTATGRTENGRHRDGGGLVTLRIFESLKPTIAAINGHAVGIGATMTLPMDIRIGTPGTKFGFVFARRGLVPDGAASWFLPRLVGIPTALEWCYSGRVFDSAEAFDRGLFSALHPAEDLLAAAKQLGREMTADTAPVSVALTRQMIWRMAGAPHPMYAHRAESRALTARGASADVREGVAAFLDKRPVLFPVAVNDGLPDIWEGQDAPRFE
ncbi:enoyl-CoA hydratase-related protein [Nocardia sp. NPDC059239]|uniref:enoyl-CoA hydratase-related protein n=1 Tax=unclassified Nocardia TaxID=2637762 RepID=UPI0036C4205E